MKKLFTLFALAIVAIAASAQEPLYTIKTIVTNDATWNENEDGIDYTTSFAFRGTEVEVEVYEEDYVIIKNWAGAEGCDLKVEYDPNVDIESEECFGNVLSLTSIINGVEQTPLTYSKEYEGYTYNFVDLATGREDYAVASTWLNEDGTTYWSFVEVDKENKTGNVQLTAYFMTADYDENDIAGEYYYVAWPQAGEEPQESEFFGTFDAETANYEYALETDLQFPTTKGIKVDAYSDHAVVYGIGGIEGYNMIVTYDANDNITSITPPSKNGNGEYGEKVTSGWATLYTGITGDWRIFQAYMVSGYCQGGADAKSGYLLLCGYNNNSDYSYYYLFWGEDEEEDGISNITTTVANSTIYNLAGQKVSNNYKGIVIKDGKKFLVK